MSESPMLELLSTGDWGEFQPQFDALAAWKFYPLLTDALRQLDRGALYDSRVHGLGHIERTLLQGAFCAMAEGLDETDTRLLLEACSYHDVGRTSDGPDECHGRRSAARIGALTGRTGEELLLLQAAVDAHARRDAVLRQTILGYHPSDPNRAQRLAELLKDADGLDRVRLGDLNPACLRREASRARAGLAQAVFNRYQTQIGAEAKPFLSREILEKIRTRERGNTDPPESET